MNLLNLLNIERGNFMYGSIWVQDLKTKKYFRKDFISPYLYNNFLRKLKYSKKLKFVDYIIYYI